MNKFTLVALGMGMLGASAHGADFAYTVRPTELKATPFSDAATVSRLAASVRVDVVERKASWTQIKTDKNTGWVKMLSLRFDQVPGLKTESGASALMNVATRGGSSSTATTGVKGVSAKDLLAAIPNNARLAEMQALQTGQSEAQTFAKAEKLTPQKISYVLSATGERK
jgi:hypothetical protein